jgi:hypothetical protein
MSEHDHDRHPGPVPDGWTGAADQFVETPPLDRGVRPARHAGTGTGTMDTTGTGTPDTTGAGTAPDREADAPTTARQRARLLADLGREVADCRCPETAERRACAGLADAPPYRAAFVAVRALDGDALAVRTGAGPAAEEAAVAGGPWVEALREGNTRVTDAGGVPEEAWPGPSPPERGSVAAVPVGRGETVDAVLGVATDRPNAFGGLERAGIEGLGSTLGLVVAAARRRGLAFGERIAELELRLTDSASPLVRLSAALDCRLAVDGYTARESGWRLVCEAEGVDVETVAERALADDAVEDCRPVIDRRDGGRLVLGVTDLPLVERAVAMGTTVGRAVADAGTVRVTLELPPSADARETIAGLRVPFPELTFRSLRETERGHTDPTLSAELFAELTDRQREALETAFEAGYFEWPRESNAEEVAADLGIASATLHSHLRKAERSLLSVLFGGRDGGE